MLGSCAVCVAPAVVARLWYQGEDKRSPTMAELLCGKPECLATSRRSGKGRGLSHDDYQDVDAAMLEFERRRRGEAPA